MAMLESKIESPAQEQTLLERVCELQRAYIRSADTKQTLNDVLNLLLELSSSQCGFIAAVDEERQLAVKATASKYQSSIWYNSEDEELSFYQRADLQACLDSETFSIINFPLKDNVVQPVLHSFLAVPLLNNGQVFALLGLANTQQVYNETLVTDLNLLFSLCEDILSTDTKSSSDLFDSKSSFLAIMSHELRTPMNGVVGLVDMLGQTKLDSEQNRMVNTIRSSAFSLLQILDDILDFSKIEAGKLQVDLIPLSVVEVVESVAQTLIPNASKKQLEFFVFVDPNIPSLVEMDPVRLRQILFNLAGNAIKFTKNKPDQAGQIYIGAHFVKEADSEWVRFVVKDNGIGISPEAQKTLFNPYVQATAQTNRLYGGTGLGLSITARLTQMLDGKIELRSELGVGSQFEVLIPVVYEKGLEKPQWEANKQCLLLSTHWELSDIVHQYCAYWGVPLQAVRSLDELGKYAKASDLGVIILDGAYSVDMQEIQDWMLGETCAAISGKRVVLSPQGYKPAELQHNCHYLHCNPLLPSSFKRLLGELLGLETEPAFVSGFEQENIIKQYPHCRILVADDNDVNREVISKQLEKFACEFDIVENGQEALEKWKSKSYNLLLIDCFMPEMDGFELAQAIRAEECGDRDECRGRGECGGSTEKSRTPIVAFTANTLVEEVQMCLNSGMDDVLAKPVELSKLAHTLDKWLEDGETKVREPKIPQDPQRVLVVEDEEMNRTMFVEMISSLGYKADAASNGVEALERLKKMRYGLVMTDLQMPHMDGLELAQSIYREIPLKKAPLVMMTGTIPAESEKPVFFDSGVNEFVAKPVSLKRLRSVLMKYLGDTSQKTELPREPDSEVEMPMDISVLEDLVGNDPGLHASLLGKFITSMDNILSEFDEATEIESYPDISALAHKLKGPAKSIGAETLAAHCQTLEAAAKKEDQAVVGATMFRLKQEAEAVRKFIQSL